VHHMGTCGRPKSGNASTSTSLRLPPETLARWKATGLGWQARPSHCQKLSVYEYPYVAHIPRKFTRQSHLASAIAPNRLF
jgi:BrnA antitoxin of type II toxin-antitoxin system